MASRASRLSSSSCGSPGLLCLEERVCWRRLMPNQPRRAFFMAAHSRSRLDHLSGPCRAADDVHSVGYFSISFLMLRAVVGGDARSGAARLLGPVSTLITLNVALVCWPLCSRQVTRQRRLLQAGLFAACRNLFDRRPYELGIAEGLGQKPRYICRGASRPP